MKLLAHLLLLLCTLPLSVYCWYNLCSATLPEKGLNLQFNSENCPILHVKVDKKHRHQPSRGFQLEVDENVEKLKLSLKENEWTSAIFKISPYNINISSNNKNQIKSFCGAITNQINNATNLWTFNCLGISLDNLGHSYLLEYKISESSDEISKKIVFFIPKFPRTSLEFKEIFTTVDFTDTSILVLKIQPLHKVSTYKIEVWRDRNGFPNLEDVRMVSAPENSQDFIDFEYHTYNEEGSYYFLISAINDKCPEDSCLKSPTPKIVIGRKNTPLVVGIVCASLVLPFVMFLLHYVTRKLKLLDGSSIGKKILIIHQSADSKHNSAIFSFGRFLEISTSIEVNYDEIPRFKDNNLERLCSDTLVSASDLIYISPPMGDDIQQIDFKTKQVAGKRITCVLFPHSNANVPAILSDYTQFKIPEEIDAFLAEFGEFKTFKDVNEYAIFLHKLEEVDGDDTITVIDTRASNEVPVIIVTDPEPHEEDKLLPQQDEAVQHQEETEEETQT